MIRNHFYLVPRCLLCKHGKARSYPFASSTAIIFRKKGSTLDGCTINFKKFGKFFEAHLNICKHYNIFKTEENLKPCSKRCQTSHGLTLLEHYDRGTRVIGNQAGSDIQAA